MPRTHAVVISSAAVILFISQAHGGAADHYRKAFAMVPERINPAESDALLMGATAPDPKDPQVVRALDKLAPVFEQIKIATSFATCDWELDYAQGLDLKLPHLMECRTLARLAIEQARRHMAAGEHDHAVDLLRQVLVVSRHTSDRAMVCRLVSVGITDLVMTFSTEYLQGMSEPSLRALDRIIKELPANYTALECAEHERQWIVTGAQRYRQNPEGIRLIRITNPQLAQELTALTENDAKWDAAIADLEENLDVMLDVVKAAPEDAKQADARLNAAKERFGVLADLLIPSVMRFRLKVDEEATRLVMLRAAIAVVSDGPDVLDEFTDPAGNGRFAYRETKGGFELISNAPHWDRPVTLRIGM